MKVYLDVSVALRRLLCQPEVLTHWGKWDEVYASILLKLEMKRAVDRLRLEGKLDDKTRAEVGSQIDEICSAVYLIPLQDIILERAGQSFPSIIGTLDALHLATALMIREQKNLKLTFLTHDIQLGLAAQSMSFSVHGI